MSTINPELLRKRATKLRHWRTCAAVVFVLFIIASPWMQPDEVTIGEVLVHVLVLASIMAIGILFEIAAVLYDILTAMRAVGRVPVRSGRLNRHRGAWPIDDGRSRGEPDE
jgi:hypothetical protein